MIGLGFETTIGADSLKLNEVKTINNPLDENLDLAGSSRLIADSDFATLDTIAGTDRYNTLTAAAEVKAIRDISNPDFGNTKIYKRTEVKINEILFL